MLILNLIIHSFIHLFMSFSCKSQIEFHFQKWNQEKTYLIKSFFSLLTFNPMVPTGVFKEFFTEMLCLLLPSAKEVAEGNVFTAVCDSVQGGLCPGGLCPGAVVSVEGGGLCRGGWSLFGGLCHRILPPTTPYGNMRVVRILLECILIIFCLMLSQQQKHK